MRRMLSGVAAMGLLASLGVLVSSSPAAAAVTATSSGTVISVSVTGAAQVGFSCNGSNQAVAGGVVSSPPVLCSAVTQFTITGDGGAQRILGEDLLGAAFTANPKLVATLGDGADRLTETDRADAVDMGLGDDLVFLSPGGLPNTVIDLGAGDADAAFFNGTDQSDTIAASSASSTVAVSVTNSAGGSTRSAVNAEELRLQGREGNDTITTASVSAGSTIESVLAFGSVGNDTLTSGPTPAFLSGDEGTNTFNGGSADDRYISASDTDVINAGSGGTDTLVDDTNGRSGRRTVGGAALKSYVQIQRNCDAQTRVRPGSGTSIDVISSLCRPGIQTLPNTVTDINIVFDDPVADRALADIVLSGPRSFNIEGGSALNDVVDLTIPSGTWTVIPGSGVTTIDPTNPAYGSITVKGSNKISVHGPWSSANQSFAHRIIRDLLFRLPTTTERNALTNALNAGTTTRAGKVAEIMDTDEYRGLDVDRVFVRFLKRAADSGGRSYWINALGDGRSLQKFRAQLFGSNEYYSKAGSTANGFVRAAYFDVLGRLPDAAGETYWTNKILSGTERGAVANAFLASTEARRAIVKDQFQRFALRLPTTTESEQWVDTLASGTGELQLIAFLAASGAYLDAD